MKSKAALGNHPIHPLLVTLPVGAFSLVLLGDIASLITQDPFWYRFSFDCLVAGILSALLAASVGLIDYVTVTMSAAGRKLATIHMVLNLSAVVLYIIDWWLRRNAGALGTNLWIPAVVLEIIALIILGSSGWIGGKMTFEHKIGVVENADPRATEIGKRETA
jgi:uncharacterized membrane protein